MEVSDGEPSDVTRTDGSYFKQNRSLVEELV